MAWMPLTASPASGGGDQRRDKTDAADSFDSEALASIAHPHLLFLLQRVVFNGEFERSKRRTGNAA
jgi:hypothetical protein